MLTEVEICNEALTSLGENMIIALTDETKAARLCNLKYANKRNYLLRKYTWNFATKRAALTAETGSTPEFEFDYEFTLPTDYIQLIEFYPNTISYAIENGMILCNEETLDIKYTYEVTDVARMDDSFAETLAALLARELAVPLSDSVNLSRQMDELFEVKISEARFAGSIESDLESIEAADWVKSRY